MWNVGLEKILIAILATYRLSLLISKDDGPYHCLDSMRCAVGRMAARGSKTWAMLAELINCPYCLGVWLGALVALALWAQWLPFDLLILALGLAGGQYAIACLTMADDDTQETVPQPTQNVPIVDYDYLEGEA